jgi:hypothetical protein
MLIFLQILNDEREFAPKQYEAEMTHRMQPIADFIMKSGKQGTLSRSVSRTW